MDILDYREQLGLTFNDEDRTSYFYTIFFNNLNSLNTYGYPIEISISEYRKFCNDAGVRGQFTNYYESAGFIFISNSLQEASKMLFRIFLLRLVAFMNCTKASRNATIKPNDIMKLVEKSFSKAHINVEFIKDSDGYFIFPQGAKELDDALVSQQLLWLKDYPLTYKKYAQTLRKYSEHSDSNSNIVDDFQKALETFFQEFFNKRKSLENMKTEYGNYLKSKGIPAEISNNMETLLAIYTNYNNHYAKHFDGADMNVLEFIMYQTGIIIRLLITISKN